MFKLFARTPQAPLVSFEPSALPALEDELSASALACGWFDSSHELTRGLRITEHEGGQAVVNDLPLGWWVDWQCRAPGRAL